jgi:hypothetical protein
VGTPSSNNTLSISLTPITFGSTPPNIADDNFAAAIQAAKAGGDATQAYFDATNQTADYWNWLTDTVAGGENPWADGVDPDGNPIQMSSNGNLDVRMGAFYRAPATGEGHVAAAAGDPPPIFGLASIQTHNTTTAVSSDISFGLGLVGLPPGIVLSSKLFQDLIKPVYSNLKTAVNKLATKFKQSSEVEDPSIDPESEAEEPISEAEGEIEDIGGELAEQGAEYLAIDYGSVLGEAAGLGVLAAIPLIVGFLGHKMVNSVMIQNMTNTDFTWSLMSQEHGSASVLPDPKENNQIPKMDYNTDSWGDKTTVKVAYEARMQFINSTDYGDIGWVLGLTPADGNPELAVLANVPWAGDNIIWAGQSAGSADDMWNQYGQIPNEQLSVVGTAGGYKVTNSITKLSGETDGQYFYGNLIVIEPA